MHGNVNDKVCSQTQDLSCLRTMQNPVGAGVLESD